jgi:hypothetical protein
MSKKREGGREREREREREVEREREREREIDSERESTRSTFDDAGQSGRTEGWQGQQGTLLSQGRGKSDQDVAHDGPGLATEHRLIDCHAQHLGEDGEAVDGRDCVSGDNVKKGQAPIPKIPPYVITSPPPRACRPSALSSPSSQSSSSSVSFCCRPCLPSPASVHAAHGIDEVGECFLGERDGAKLYECRGKVEQILVRLDLLVTAFRHRV